MGTDPKTTEQPGGGHAGVIWTETKTILITVIACILFTDTMADFSSNSDGPFCWGAAFILLFYVTVNTEQNLCLLLRELLISVATRTALMLRFEDFNLKEKQEADVGG